MTETRTSMPNAKGAKGKDAFARAQEKVAERQPNTTQEIAEIVEEMKNDRSSKEQQKKDE